MKYVRTKDGETGLAIILESEHYYHNELCYCGAESQADTIEELCDEFVLSGTKYHKPCVTKLPLDFLKECVITKTYYDLVVYGAIWTDKGLIYVAKMKGILPNGEVDWELL